MSKLNRMDSPHTTDKYPHSDIAIEINEPSPQTCKLNPEGRIVKRHTYTASKFKVIIHIPKSTKDVLKIYLIYNTQNFRHSTYISMFD